MSNNSALLKQAQQTETGVDHSTPTKGGPRIPVEGKCPARLVGYIELGVQEQGEYKGQAKDPCMEVQLVFECFGKDNMDEIEIDGKKKKVGRIIRPFPMTIKVNERAKFYKMFKAMDYDRGLDHMSKMLNDVFRLTISHKEAKGTGNKYAVIDVIESPLIEKVDPDTGDVVGHTDISEKVPPASYDLQLFIVEHPTYEQWDSIFIDGTYEKTTKNEDGSEVTEEVSKNFIQEKIKSSLDWEGSAMQTLLLDLAEDAEAFAGEEEAEVEEKPKAKKKTTTKKKTETKPAKEEETVDSTDDMLAELGLDE